MALNKTWVTLRNLSFADYVRGVDNFLSFAFSSVREEDREMMTIRCPCDRCCNIFFKKKCEVRLDLLKWGMYENYTIWEFHGERSNNTEENGIELDDDDIALTMLKDACGVASMEFGEDGQSLNDNEQSPPEPNENAKKFYRLLKEYQDPLTVEGAKMSKLSYIVKLLHLKVLNNWSDSSFDSLLKLQRDALGAALPNSFYEAKKLIKDLGLDYIKIDACQNDCVLYWKDNEGLNECPTCGLSRWKTVDVVSSKGGKVSNKVLRYFPLKARLQRLYISRKTAKDMQWHKLERVDGKIMRHPADFDAWKSFDKDFGEFSADARNVRLGLASDGFQPFNNSQHSIWPVVLIPYNLPPWLCMKPHSFMLTLLIPGPTSPGRNIDVYLQSLIEELKELWEAGIETYDAYSRQNFKLHAAVLWTINDFPAYGDVYTDLEHLRQSTMEEPTGGKEKGRPRGARGAKFKTGTDRDPSRFEHIRDELDRAGKAKKTGKTKEDKGRGRSRKEQEDPVYDEPYDPSMFSEPPQPVFAQHLVFAHPVSAYVDLDQGYMPPEPGFANPYHPVFAHPVPAPYVDPDQGYMPPEPGFANPHHPVFVHPVPAPYVDPGQGYMHMGMDFGIRNIDLFWYPLIQDVRDVVGDEHCGIAHYVYLWVNRRELCMPLVNFGIPHGRQQRAV